MKTKTGGFFKVSPGTTGNPSKPCVNLECRTDGSTGQVWMQLEPDECDRLIEALTAATLLAKMDAA